MEDLYAFNLSATKFEYREVVGRVLQFVQDGCISKAVVRKPNGELFSVPIDEIVTFYDDGCR